MLDALLARRGLAIRQLDGIAFGEGPGSFTGLRFACGVTQGLAFGAGIPVVGIGTLAAMAEATPAESVVCCLDARMGEIYHAAYGKSGAAWRAVHAPSLCAPAEAPPVDGSAWTGCGSGFAVHGPVLRQRYAGQLTGIMQDIIPHARHIARLAALEFKAGRAVPAEQAVPVY